ncbi:MAG: Rpn family recombination-promoting nuclease/putative transposase [Lachnospiraceae bacterium]|nr:Rpn family recombination-promoting nuclease/putative transposase [Lachnospiraceae bacterium]
MKKNRRKSKFIHRFRDAVRKTSVMTDDQCAYVIIGIEAQTKTHYAMAVRNIIYDGLQYAQQVDDLQVGHRINGDVESSEEFLSGMHREDRLIPVITICLYFGTEPWDGALSLMELFDLPDERLLPYIQDYEVFLMEPSRMSDEDFGKFSTNLGQVLKFMKVAQDKKKLAELVNSDDAFKKLDRKAAQVIRDYAKVEINIEPEQEEVNMCKGWYDAIEDARKEEREAAQEREEELRAAANTMAIYSVVEAYKDIKMPSEDIRSWIMKKYDLTETDADRYLAFASA